MNIVSRWGGVRLRWRKSDVLVGGSIGRAGEMKGEEECMQCFATLLSQTMSPNSHTEMCSLGVS